MRQTPKVRFIALRASRRRTKSSRQKRLAFASENNFFSCGVGLMLTHRESSKCQCYDVTKAICRRHITTNQPVVWLMFTIRTLWLLLDHHHRMKVYIFCYFIIDRLQVQTASVCRLLWSRLLCTARIVSRIVNRIFNAAQMMIWRFIGLRECFS